MKGTKPLLDIACIILAVSAIMDSFLWLTVAYTVPCWTITAICIAVIMLVQVIKKEIISETAKKPRRGTESARSDEDSRI